MKIDFTQTDYTKTEAGIGVAGPGASAKSVTAKPSQIRAAGVVAEFGSSAVNGMRAYGKKNRSVLDSLNDVTTQNEMLNRNYMAVMANTMSGNDFREMVENGYQPGEMQPEDAVNSLDRMKVKLAEAGVNVAGYTDTVSSDKAAEITGSKVRAEEITGRKTQTAEITSAPEPEILRTLQGIGEEGLVPAGAQIADGLKAVDLPATQENIRGVRDAYRIAAELKPVSDAARKYMIENSMEPTISNVYEAQFSAGGISPGGQAGYFSADGSGYLAEAAGAADFSGNKELQHQIEEVIREAGLEVSEETGKDAGWLIENGIPLTPDTLNSLNDLKAAEPKADFREISNAIALGKRPTDAYLIRDYGRIRAERQLKETALVMTTEANRKLMKSDYSVDTSALEDEVEALKQDEKRLWDLMDETAAAVSEVREAPAEIITEIAFVQSRSADFLAETDGGTVTLSALRSEGAALRLKYESAQQTYEAVGTEVRKDLGDSIRKAFQNVDDILEDLRLEPDEENRRAVRMLGYQSMEITPENIERVQEADRQVNRVLDGLTPPNVLKLIRDNVNPLTVSIGELDEKLAEYEQKEEKESEQFAQYLVRLQHAGEVTDEEAASYIGIYRLVDKIVKSDGAAVSALVNQNAELSMKNLLSAVRSSRRGRLDVMIDEHFGGIDAVDDASIRKIDTEIATAFSREYYEKEAKQFADAAKAEAELYRMLESAGMETSANNVNAAAELFAAHSGFFRRFYDGADDTGKKRITDASKRAVDSMDDPEEFSAAYDEMVNAELIAAFDHKDERIDIRAMQLQHKVLSVQRSLADAENYQVPVLLNGEITSINLQIKHGENAGTVDILFEDAVLGRISASFFLEENRTQGMVVCSRKEGADYLREKAEEIRQAVSLNQREVTLEVIRETGSIEARPMNATDGEHINTAVLYQTAKAFIGGFIYEDQQ